MTTQIPTTSGEIKLNHNSMVSINGQSIKKLRHRKLCYRRQTVRRVMLVTLCYVSLGIGVRKVSNSKSDLQGHSMTLAIVPFNRPHTITC